MPLGRLVAGKTRPGRFADLLVILPLWIAAASVALPTAHRSPAHRPGGRTIDDTEPENDLASWSLPIPTGTCACMHTYTPPTSRCSRPICHMWHQTFTQTISPPPNRARQITCFMSSFLSSTPSSPATTSTSQARATQESWCPPWPSRS